MWVIRTSLLYTLSSVFGSVCDLQLSVLSSERTPTFELRLIQSLRTELNCSVEVVSVTNLEDLENLKKPQSTVQVDLLFNEFLSVSFGEVKSDWGVPILSGNNYFWPALQSFRFSLEVELKALTAIAKSIGLTRICLFLPAGIPFNPLLFESKPDQELKIELLSEDVSIESLRLIIHMEITHFGFTSFLLIISANLAEKLISAMAEWSTTNGGLRIFLSTQGGYYIIDNRETVAKTAARSAIFLIREGCETSENSAQLLLCEIQQTMKDAASSTLTIMNVRGSTLVEVGSVAGECVNLTAPILTIDEQKQSFSYQTITISFNNGTLDPSGDTNYGDFYDYIGALLAIKSINNDPSILPYHELQIFNVSLGLSEFDRSWALTQISPFSREDLGVAMLCGTSSEVSMGVYSLLASLDYNIPQIGSSNTNPILSSVSKFPLYSRVMMSDEYLSMLYTRIIKHYDWKHIAIVYSTDSWSTALYNLILAETQRLQVSIGNPNTTRMMELEPTPSEYMATFQGIVDSKCRVVILILYGSVLYNGIAMLYDLGLRRGDILFLAIEWLDSKLFEQEDTDMRIKIAELCHGAIQFFPASLVGDIGRAFATQYEAATHRAPSIYSCFYYDSANLLAHALDYLVTNGISNNSPASLMKSIRNTRFRGCSGLVSVDQGSNDRSPMMYYIWNARVDEEGRYSIVNVGTYDPAGLVLFNFTEEIIWPDGTSIVPTDTRGSSQKCPFDESAVRFYTPAVITMTVIIWGLSLIMVFVTGCIWTKRWNYEANPLRIRAEISFDDYYVFGNIAVDGLQYATMGPLTAEWSHSISYVTSLFTAQMDTVMDTSQGQFWSVLIITYSVVGLWAALFFSKKLRACHRFKWIQTKIDGLASALVPLIGNLCFLPVLSILLSVFQCLKTAHGTGLQSTFLTQDCYQNCWVPPHVYYAAASTLCLFLYVPAAVWLRPTWQESAEDLHIHTAPSYLMAKTMYEMAIVACQNTVKRFHQITHIILFLLITIAFCAYTLVKKPFGYERANLWHTLSLIGVLWFALLSLITSQVTIGNALTWLGIFVLGNVCIICFGAVWQCLKIPSMLYRREAVRYGDLFKFMFSRHKSYLYIFNHSNHGIKSGDEDPRNRRIFTFAVPHSCSSPL